MRVKVPVTRVRALLIVGVCIVTGVFGLVTAGPASAAAYDCSGRSASYILHTFSVLVPFRLPVLRCGTSSYGYLHIKSRYDSDPLFEENIQNTLEYPDTFTNSGTSETFYALSEGCEPGAFFRVVVEYSNYSDGKPKGIITAYATNTPEPAAAHLKTAGRVTPLCG